MHGSKSEKEWKKSERLSVYDRMEPVTLFSSLILHATWSLKDWQEKNGSLHHLTEWPQERLNSFEGNTCLWKRVESLKMYRCHAIVGLVHENWQWMRIRFKLPSLSLSFSQKTTLLKLPNFNCITDARDIDMMTLALHAFLLLFVLLVLVKMVSHQNVHTYRQTLQTLSLFLRRLTFFSGQEYYRLQGPSWEEEDREDDDGWDWWRE